MSLFKWYIDNYKFWKRLGGKPNFKNKTVLDFGCGYGHTVDTDYIEFTEINGENA